jgi:hypothetical protein
LKQSRSLFSFLMIFLSAVAIIGLGWANYRFSKYNVNGEGFSVQWISIHRLVTTSDSPYSDQVSTQIRETVKNEGSFTAGNIPRYSSPLFSGLVVLPFALIGDQSLAHALWSTAQLIAIFGILGIGLKLTSWKPRWYVFLLFSLGLVFSYQVIIPWQDGNLSIWSSLFLALAFLAISANRNELAGISIALSAIQPQMVILPIIFTLIWAGRQKRRILILWFFITLVFLSVIGLLLVPDWLLQYLRLIYNFRQNFPPGTPGLLFKSIWPGLGTQLGWLLSGVLALILLIEWWLALRRDFRWYFWTVCLTIVISQWIGIPTIPANFSGLIIPLILISAMLTERWTLGGSWAAILITLILSAWEWALLNFDLTGMTPFNQLNLLIPLPLVLLIGLYWVRWWAVKPRRLLVEELKLGETY